MIGTPATVVIIDDDEAFCRSTERLIRMAESRTRVKVFNRARQLLRAPRPDPPACVVLEARLAGLSGLEAQQALAGSGIAMPLIFVARRGNIPMAVKALKAGAVDFLPKPVRDAELLAAILEALRRDQAVCNHRRHLAVLRTHYARLTPRERGVMTRVVTGFLNKQTAAELGITEKTVKFHRGNLMRKMKAQSVVELAKMAEALRGAVDESDSRKLPPCGSGLQRDTNHQDDFAKGSGTWS